MEPKADETSSKQAEQTKPLNQREPAKSTANKRSRKWLKVVGIAVAGFVAVIVGAIIFAYLSTNAPKKISDQFVNYVQSDNSDGAYSLTSSSFRDVTSKDELEQAVKQIGPLLQGEEKVTGRAIRKYSGLPSTAVIVYSIGTSDGTKYIKVELQENSGAWQVLNFRSSENPLDTSID